MGSVEASYYDRAYSRWLPVSRNAVSPDGTHYAFTDRPAFDGKNPPTGATLHVVAVETGVELAFDGGYWLAPYIVLDYAAEGIYLITAYEGPPVGLWLMNPATGAVKQVAVLSDVQGSAGNKSFWVGSVNPSDPNPIPGMGGTPDQIERLNLVDGSRVVWLYRPDSMVTFAGQDLAGHPIVSISGEDGRSTELLLLLDPSSQRTILTTAVTPASLGGAIADSHGIWFGSPDGIYLYSEANGLHKVSNQPGYPANRCF